MEQEFSILSDKGDEYVERVVRYVNERAAETRKVVQESTNLGVAILVALNIADELFEERGKRDLFHNQLESRTAELIDYIKMKEHTL
jgi:cell division protein ZapA (FtsZ GTPase activity inhibitor)